MTGEGLALLAPKSRSYAGWDAIYGGLHANVRVDAKHVACLIVSLPL